MKVLLGTTQLAPRSVNIPNETEGKDDHDDDLESDFQRHGKLASWAVGYPKQWGHEYWCFSSGRPLDDLQFSVKSVSATPDEKFLALTTNDSVCIFETDGFKLVSVLKSDFGLAKTVEFAKVKKDGSEGYLLAVESEKDISGATKQVKMWHLDKECKERSVFGSQGEKELDWIVNGGFPPFSPTALSPDSKTLLYLDDFHDKWGSHPRVTAVDAMTGKSRFSMQGHKDRIMWAGFSPSSEFIASTAWDGYLRLYNGCSGKLIRDYGPTGGQNWACDFSTDSRNLAVSRGNPLANTFVWRTDDPQSFPITLHGIKGAWQRVITFSPDGKHLAIAAADGRLVVYETNALTLRQVWQLGNVPRRWIQEVSAIKWLNGGKRILFKPNNGSVQMYDFISNRKWKWAAKESDKWRMGAFSHGLIVLENKGLFGSVDQDGSLRIWKIPE
ncbi:WD40-repeat-containing domain protein [Xylogone sp. PMI_703]|nr:WD40-repeat-containing domain protein [Xylogone sp. PMI_703]